MLSYEWSQLIHSNPTIWDATNLPQYISTSLTKIKNTYLKLHSYYNALIHPDIEILQSYFIGNITKIELGEILKSMEKSWDVLYQLKADLQIQIRDKDSLVNVYERILTADFPIMKSKNVYKRL